METESDAYMKRLSGSLVHLRASGKLCDTVLVTSDRQLLAHSIVLAAASPVFCAAFQSCTADGCMNYQLQLDELDGQLMETILNCIYHGYTVPLDDLCSVLNTESVIEICEQLGVSWIINDKTSDLLDQRLQTSTNERCKLITGCYEQTEVERCHSVQPAMNNIDSNGSFCDTVVVYDSHTADDIEPMAASSAETATEVDPSVTEELLRVYVCDMCSRRLSTDSALRRHRHHHRGCATCNECGHSFHSPVILHHHTLMQCPRRTVTCNICHRSCDGWPSLSKHTATTHSVVCLCSLCGQAFLHVSQLVTHRNVHATYVYECRICHQSFGSQRHVKRHIRKHVSGSGKAEVLAKCLSEVNGEHFGLENHLNLVNGDAPAFRCQLKGLIGGERVKEVSEDACISVDNLNNVVRDDHVIFQQETVPEAVYASEPQMKDTNSAPLSLSHSLVHSALEMPLSESSAACNGLVDGRCIILRFNKSGEVSVARPAPRQARTAVKATSPRRVTCAKCSRTFKRLADLHVHMQCHTGEMRYKCSECGRPFRKNGTLARHMRIHTGERPYVCEVCGKSFKHLFHLRLHTTGHSSDLPFACDVCEKAFRTASSLKKHQFVHSGLKPFSCPVCSRVFSRCNNMHAHIRAVHDGARQPKISAQKQDCIFCRRRFGTVAGLQSHLQTHAHQLELDVGETIAAFDAADSSAPELTYCRVEKQADDVYIALPHVHFDDCDVS